MGSVMNYDEGPITRIGFNYKKDVKGKVSGQSTKEMTSHTFKRMATAKKD